MRKQGFKGQAGLQLRSIYIGGNALKKDRYPFSVPAIAQLETLEFQSPMTILVGENGSGKSTLLEIIAAVARLPTVGSEAAHSDPTLKTLRELSPFVKLTWSTRKHRGFFLRAEDFFGFARRIANMRLELEADLAQAVEDTRHRSITAQQYATSSYKRELAALQESYGEGLDVQSHGESFLLLFQQRFVPGGLYLLDEPEAPLSPVRQLALLALLKQMLRQDTQFILATHSPILMAFPDAQILEFTNRIQPVAYEQVEHVQVTRDFLNNPQAYLRRLGEDEHA